MNKKGLTIVEVVVAFSLTTVISLFLIQVVVFLKDTYVINALRSEIVLKQSTISERLNDLFLNNEISKIERCDGYCINVYTVDGRSYEINFDAGGNRVIIGDYVADLPGGSYLKDILFSKESISGRDRPFNRIYIINATIVNTLVEDEDFNVNLIYQYNEDE